MQTREIEWFLFVMTWKENLINLYLLVCEDEAIQNYLKTYKQSPNQEAEFTDEEVMTLYLFGISQGMSKVKQVHRHTRHHLQNWFPRLPSYQAFNDRLNNLSACFELLASRVTIKALPKLLINKEKVIDSMPIMVAGNSRSSSAKVAKQICSKGYNSSKQTYYYGLKLHTIGIVRPGTLPMPESSWITGAHESDLTAARPVFECQLNTKIYADKIYGDADLNKNMIAKQNAIIITPIKKAKGHVFQDAANDLFSTAVSRVRQPIESFFNWIIEKTQIQNANRVRSERGLLVHVWGKYAVALLLITKFLTLD